LQAGEKVKPGPNPGSPREKRNRGTFKPYRHADLAHVDAPGDLPVAPPWLTPGGREAWLDLIPRLAVTKAAVEVDSVMVGTLANLIAACGDAWRSGAVPPAAHLAELRRLSELLRIGGETSRVVGLARKGDAPNPFANNGRPPSPKATG
jgi:hypothetical protein